MPQDRYFASNFDYNEFMKWLQDTKNSILSLNQFSATNTVPFDPKILKNFALTKVLSDAIKTSNKNEIAKHVDDNLKTSTMIAEAIKQINEEAIAEQNSTIESELKISQQNYFKDNADRMSKLNTEINNRNPNDVDINNPIPIEDRIDSNTMNKYGAAQDQFYTQDGFESQEDFITKSRDTTEKITNVLNSQTQFEVVSGYKPKNDKTPPAIEYKSWVVQNADKSWTADARKTFTPERPYSDYANEVLEKIQAQEKTIDGKNSSLYPGSYKFFIEKLHGRYSDGTPYKKNGIKSQRSSFGDRNLSNRMLFSAYIDNYYDSYNVSWGESNLLGRADPIPSYKSTTRNMVLEFTILSDYSKEMMVAMAQLNKELNRHPDTDKDELLQKLISESGYNWGLGTISNPSLVNGDRVGGHVPGMYSDTPEGLWSKITFLAQCCYPYFRDDGKMKEQPLIRMRIADFYDVIVFPKDFQIAMSTFDGPMIDLNPSSLGAMPFGLKVTLSGTIIHNNEPSSNYFGFYHRDEFDKNTLDPITGVGEGSHSAINLQHDKLSAAAITTESNTDTTFNTAKIGTVESLVPKTFNNAKTLSPLNLEIKKRLEPVADNFQQSYEELKKIKITDTLGIDLKGKFIQQQTKKSIEAFGVVQNVVKYLRIQAGISEPLPGQEKKKLFDFSSISSAVDTYKNLKGDYVMAKNSYNTIKGVVNSSKASVDSLLSAAERTVTDFNINDIERIGQNQILNNAESIIKNLSSKKQPKTIGEITEKAKGINIDYSNQAIPQGTTGPIDPVSPIS